MFKVAALIFWGLAVAASASGQTDATKLLTEYAAESPESSLLHRLVPQSVENAVTAGEVVANRIDEAAGLDGVILSNKAALIDLAFRLRPKSEDAPYQPLSYSTGVWYDSTFWTGPDWTRVGKNWHHPGENTPSVRRFVAPRDGQIAIRGRVFKLHQAGDGVRLSILHGEKKVWNAEIDGADGQGVQPELSLGVRQGDALRFIVHKRGSISCDTTHWDPVITYDDGTKYQASESFGKMQGAGGWRYEMLGNGPQEQAQPAIVTLTRNFGIRRLPLDAENAVDLNADGALPFVVIDDPASSSGVVLAWEHAAGWRFGAALNDDGLLGITLVADSHGRPRDDLDAESGSSTVLLTAYNGPWTSTCSVLRYVLSEPPTETRFERLRSQLRTAHRLATGKMERAPDPEMLLMAQSDWHPDDAIDENARSYIEATSRQLAFAHEALVRLQQAWPSLDVQRQTDWLGELSDRVSAEDAANVDWQAAYVQARLLKREILLKNPLLDFDTMLLCKRVPPSWSHLVAQYYGWRQRPGGGLFVLEEPGQSLRCRDLIQGRLPPGNYLEPRLSYDARHVVFSFVACGPQGLEPAQLVQNELGTDEAYFHIHELNLGDGQLRQVTDGPYDDMMPTYLPDGGVAFCSSRRQAYSRCFGPEYSRRWDSYTVHRMERDGGGLKPISSNDVSEWFPAVSNSGHLLFARWDYIDRDAVTHQNLWAMRPDGTNPVAVWGNATPKPHCTFQAKPIPGSSKIVFVASAHHSITAGPVCIVDPTIDPNSHDAITRVTPGAFPEAESSQIPEYYESPWPLSEDLFLVAYSRDRLRFQGEHPRNPNPDNALGIYVLDTAGNRELIYRDPLISSTNPTPLVPRQVPPILPDVLDPADASCGEMVLSDVYQGLGDVARGTIKQLRIVQIFPKTTPVANQPLIGFAGEENARAILGTVPVEADGSAYFRVPANKPILFQALDQDGLAYQTMRSTTYVQGGERTACIGCHEHRMQAPPGGPPLALGRPPSEIVPGELGGQPFSYVDVVQPILDQQCVRCHGQKSPDAGVDLTGTPHQGFTRSYWSLCGTAQDFNGGGTNPENAAKALVPRFGQRNQVQVTPVGGIYGARGSRLLKLLRAGHEDVRLDDRDVRHLAAWIDMNAVFYGSYHADRQAKELAGQVLDMPDIQ